MDFLGAPYPIVDHPLGLLHTQRGINQIKSDLLILLQTNPGERVMLADFGTPLKRLIFEPNDRIIVTRARQMIIDSIRTWEPRVTVQQIEVRVGADENDLDSADLKQDIGHILSIKIMFFDPENIKEVQELRLEVPLTN